MSVTTTKEECRARFRAYREGLGSNDRRTQSALIFHRALRHPALAAAQTVHVYWPQPGSGEVDTRPLIAALRARGVTIVLPVVTSYEPGAPAMEHRRYDGPRCLQPNRWGIPEPTGTPRVPTEALDVVIVPALGAGRDGHRIGHGAGYYDAFLSSVTAPRLGLVYEACLVPSVPSAPHDVPLTAIITERGIHPIATAP